MDERSEPGTYYIKRYAHDGTCNTAWVPSSGKYTLTVLIPVPVPPGSNSGDTWTCGSQIWSGALRNPAGCVAVSDLGEDYFPAAQYINYSPLYGYYYNCSCVNTYANTLCPLPWRVPTVIDFQTLISCTTASTLSSAWGLPGTILRGSMAYQGVMGEWWSSYGSSGGAPTAKVLNYTSSNMSVSGNGEYWHMGIPVRCVRDL